MFIDLRYMVRLTLQPIQLNHNCAMKHLIRLCYMRNGFLVITYL